MDEKILIKGDVKKNYFSYIMFGLAIIIAIIALAWASDIYANDGFIDEDWRYFDGRYYLVGKEYVRYSDRYPFDLFLEWFFFDFAFGWILVIGSPLFLLVGLFTLFWLRCDITVTNLRVYGKSAWGKKIDLPLNQITSLGTGILGKVSLDTSLKRNNFWLIKNNEEIYNTVSDIIINNSTEPNAAESNKAGNNVSIADELKKYKELLDMGAITQEEFDEKKKELLSI